MKLRAFAGNAKRFVCRRGEEIVVTCDLTVDPPPARQKDIQVQLIEPDHEPLVTEIARQAGSRPPPVRDYLRLGYGGFLALRGTTCMGYVWWTDAAVPPADQHPVLDRFNLRLGADGLYLFEFMVAPAHRDGGSAAAFLHAVQRRLRERGYKRACGIVACENLPARLLYRMMNWKEGRRVASWRLCRALLYMDRRLFARNTRWSRITVDWRQVARFRRSDASPVPAQNGAGSSVARPGPSLE